ncbi:hypothetical protein BYT27DRAFT_7243269 [Phlegmacium glaucopus]|nr:hypothetical protein BYT27DRAFT_7243269 [Phlegmacium glaucopus]
MTGSTLSASFVYINHEMFDMAGSLLGFAVMMDSLILLVSPVSPYGPGARNSSPSSSIIATVASQVVAKGFLQWPVSSCKYQLQKTSSAMIRSYLQSFQPVTAGTSVGAFARAYACQESFKLPSCMVQFKSLPISASIAHYHYRIVGAASFGMMDGGKDNHRARQIKAEEYRQ